MTAEGNDPLTKMANSATAAAVATAGLAWAVETPMGPEAGVWASAVRARTRHLIEQSSGAFWDSDKVYVSDFWFPRRATVEAHRALDKGAHVVLISGPPFLGKSHVLREYDGED